MPIGGLGIVGLDRRGDLGGAALESATRSSFGVISGDNFGLFVTLVLVVVGILTIMFSSQVVDRDGIPAGEYYTLMLFAIAGMIMMATANDLLVIFIALEILSLAVYVLTGIRRDDPRATEAAFKYFLLGAFSSAFFLYGIAFTFGLTGSTHLDRDRLVPGRAVAVGQPAHSRRRSACCSSASPSRSPRCRFTCGRPTPTRARRPSSPASCRRA